GVDIKIGLDIATLALKKLVQKIVLISGDSDFVPASKLARVEGIIFTLDPMGNHIREDLKEHIDYLTTRLPQFKQQ
ncbi:NYN domain-containing protein, partial [Helicobacter pylori]